MKTMQMVESTIIDEAGADLLLQIVVINNVTHDVTKIGCRTPTEFKSAMREITNNFLHLGQDMVTIHIGDWRDN